MRLERRLARLETYSLGRAGQGESRRTIERSLRLKLGLPLANPTPERLAEGLQRLKQLRSNPTPEAVERFKAWAQGGGGASVL